MQIKYLGGEKFEVRSNQGKIDLGYTVAIDGFALPGPGEYEKGGVSVTGIPDNQNTIYLLHTEEIGLCYLGKLSRDLPADEIKQIGNVDILFLPLGEDGTLSAKKAIDLINKIDPRVVVPMLYSDLTEFKKSEVVTEDELDVLKIRKVDLPEEERKTFVLKASTK